MPLSVAISRSAVQWRPDTGAESFERMVPDEVAVGLSFNGRPHTVLMATPADIEDLARGFTLTESIAAADDILDVRVEVADLGLMVDVRLRPGAVARKARPRNLEGRSSCGLCGVQRLADAVRPLPALGLGRAISHQAVQGGLEALIHNQSLGRLTRATHAAAFADASGRILLSREDVGRHNALDKLAGAMAGAGLDAATGFVLITSRCSFEMVEKAVRIGCPVLVAVSAPTDLAIRKAEEAGLTLIALARSDGHIVFTRADRLIDAKPENL